MFDPIHDNLSANMASIPYNSKTASATLQLHATIHDDQNMLSERFYSFRMRNLRQTPTRSKVVELMSMNSPVRRLTGRLYRQRKSEALYLGQSRILIGSSVAWPARRK